MSYGSILDLESILKQITPDTDDDVTTLRSRGESERFRRNELTPHSPDASSQEKHTEKRETDSEDSKRFSVVKLPDLMTAQRPDNSTTNISNSDDAENSSGSGDEEDSETSESSGSGESEVKNDDDKEAADSSKKSNMEGTTGSSSTSNSEDDDESGSGSGGEASGSGADFVSGDKRNLMENLMSSTPNINAATPINSTASQRGTVSLPSPLSVSGNVSKVVMTTQGSNIEKPLTKEEKKNVTTNHTLTEIKYFKEENITTPLQEKPKFNENQTFDNVLSAINKDGIEDTSSKIVSTEPTNLQSSLLNSTTSLQSTNVSIPSNASSIAFNETAPKTSTATTANLNNATQITKKYSLPRTPEEIELSAEANKLFNFEAETANEEESNKESMTTTTNNNKMVAAASNQYSNEDDSLPGSQGGQIGEDIMSTLSSNENKTPAITNNSKSSGGKDKSENTKKWKVVDSSSTETNPDESSGSGGGLTADEIKMEVESTIGSSFDASMKRAGATVDGEILPGDYGDENSLQLSELSGSGSGVEESSGTSEELESGSGGDDSTISAPVVSQLTKNTSADYLDLPSSSKRANLTLANNGDVENNGEISFSGEAESGSGIASGGSASGSEETSEKMNKNSNSNHEVNEGVERETSEQTSSPFGLGALEAMSNDMKIPFASIRREHHKNISVPMNISAPHVDEGADEENDRTAEGEDEFNGDEESGSGETDEESGDSEETPVLKQQSKDTINNSDDDTSSEDVDEAFELPKKSPDSEENGLAKDHVSRNNLETPKDEEMEDTTNESLASTLSDSAADEQSKNVKGKKLTQ